VWQNGVTNTEIHRNVATAQFGGRMDVRTRVKLLFQIGLQRRVSGLLHVRESLAFRFSVQNSIISSSRED
jgi:hypothetical protein